MIFQEDDIIIVQSVDRWGRYFLIRENGTDVTFKIEENTVVVLFGKLTPKEWNYIFKQLI